jgi:phage portal protein BeeE
MLASLLGTRQRAASPAIQWTPAGSENFGPGLGNQPPTDVLLRESLGPFDAASRAIANRLSELELLVKVVRRTRAGTTEDEELDDHPLKKLLDHPHPNWTLTQLLFLAARQILSAGETYWQKVGNGFGMPVELHPMTPGQIAPLVDRGILVGYSITDGIGHQGRIPANVVIRPFFPDPENPWNAEGYLSPTGIAADMHKFAMQHLRHHYENDATPKGVLEVGPNAQNFTPDQLKIFDNAWMDRNHSRAGRGFAPQALPQGYTYKGVSVDTREGMTPLLEYARDDLLMTTATPRSVLGQVVSGDRSSADVNQYVFDRYAVKPIANLIANTLTLQLAVDFDETLVVCFEDFVSEDKDFTLRREAHDLEHALRTPNKVLTDRNDDEVEWGDQPLIAGSLGTYDPDAPEPAAIVGETIPDEDDENAERSLHRAVRNAFRGKRRAA